MNDIVERLRRGTEIKKIDAMGNEHTTFEATLVEHEAAAEIDRLRADNARLEAEVKRLSGTPHGAHVLSMDAALKDNRRQAKEIERLRAALREIDENLNVIQPQTQGSVLYQIRNVARRALEGEMKRYAAVDEAAKLAREQTATLREALTMNRHDIVERLRGYAEAKDD